MAHRIAYGIFAGLGVSVFILAQALNLNGYWHVVTVTMLMGYLLAPQAIWKLSSELTKLPITDELTGRKMEDRK